jgi:hypothetical protein
MSCYDEIHGLCPYCEEDFVSQTKIFTNELRQLRRGDRVTDSNLNMYLGLKSECQHCHNRVVARIENGLLKGLIKLEAFPKGELQSEGLYGSLEPVKASDSKRPWSVVKGGDGHGVCLYCNELTPMNFYMVEEREFGPVYRKWYFCDDECVDKFKEEVNKL